MWVPPIIAKHVKIKHCLIILWNDEWSWQEPHSCNVHWGIISTSDYSFWNKWHHIHHLDGHRQSLMEIAGNEKGKNNFKIIYITLTEFLSQKYFLKTFNTLINDALECRNAEMRTIHARSKTVTVIGKQINLSYKIHKENILFRWSLFKIHDN